MIWVFFVIIATLFWAFSNIFDKVLRIRYLKNSLALTAGFGLYSMTFTFGIFLFVGIPIIPFWSFIASLFAGISITFVVIPYIKALSIEEASRVVPLWNLSPVFTLILAVIFLNEILVPLSYLAFIFLLFGGVLISTRKIGSAFHLSPAVGFMLISSIMVSISDVLLKFAYSGNPFWPTFLIFYFGISIGSVSLFLFKNVRRNFSGSYSKYKNIFLLVLFFSVLSGVLGHAFFSRAISLGPITLVSVFGSFQSLFVLIIATFLSIKYPFFIKEAIDAKTISIKLVAIVLMAIGVFLLSI